jgi:hypothetical protein
MKRTFVALTLFALLMAGVGSALAEDDACEGLLTGDQVGVDYEGHCILVEPEKGPVQGVIVRRVEDLDGVSLEGIIIMQTKDGWELVEETFYTPITNDLKTVAVGDGWHMELDPTE